MTVAYAPGKAILFGEHAVVYGRPAIAVPVTQVQARAEVTPSEGGLILAAPDLDRQYTVTEAPPDDPLALTVRNTLTHLGVDAAQDLRITVTATIPLARGLGSGAAIATAIVRALAGHFGQELPPAQVSALVFQTEILYHGTPSGVDNTVVAFAQPVYFVQGQPLERFAVAAPLRLAIGDTGIVRPTRLTVGEVRRGWQADPETYEARFDAITDVVERARRVIEAGDLHAVGRLMDENQAHLCALGVSSPELERLIKAARAAGALGAKLSGAGRGGNMIALVTPETEEAVRAALQAAGAVVVIVTEVSSQRSAFSGRLIADSGGEEMASAGRAGGDRREETVAGLGGTLAFLKLGGSLITDKLREGTARPEVIRRAAREIAAALVARPDLGMVLGHGSGSFGHFAARRHRLLTDARPNWRGYAETGAAAARLNRLVVDLCLEEGLPVVSLQPSASAVCQDGELVSLVLEPLIALLQAQCIPVVYGDVAVDQVRGHTIISTERIFAYLAARLRPDRIVLAGDVAGVLTGDPARDPAARRVPQITPVTLAEVEAQLGGSAGVDVTGGMLAKVREMLALVERLPGLEVWIVSGEAPGMIGRALTGEPVQGTVLRGQGSASAGGCQA